MCAVVLLTGFVSAGFTVPFVSLLDVLNFMPSAANNKMFLKKHRKMRRKKEYKNIDTLNVCDVLGLSNAPMMLLYQGL